MKGKSNRYDPDEHESALNCPRSRCQAQNAPQSSSDFHPHCWKCSAELPREQPVSVGDEYVIDIVDMAEGGEGVGRTEEGFVIFVDGILPEATAKVRIKQVRDSYARAELLEREPANSSGKDEHGDEKGEDGDDPSLGSRENFWG